MPRITAVCQYAYPGVTTYGGADSMMASLLEHLVLMGWSARVILPGRTAGISDVNGVEVHRTKGQDNINALCKDADVIITHLGATPMAKKAGALHGVPVVQLVHNTSELTAALLGTGCDFAVYNSHWVSDYHDRRRRYGKVLTDYAAPGRRTLRRRVAEAWPSIIVRPPTEGFYYAGGNPGGKITLLNLVPNKGPDLFYDLAIENPDLEFLAVKGGYDVDKQFIRDLPNVTISEFSFNVREVYNRTSVLVVPSKYESYSRVAVEAMARGIPVIGADTPGLRESLGPIGTHERTVSAFNTALQDVLQNYSARSRESSARFFDLERQSESDLELFEFTMRGLASGVDLDLLSRGNAGV